MKEFSISNASINQSAVATAPVSIGSLNGSPVISANGANNGIVWVLNNNSGNSGSSGALYAFNALNISQELWDSTAHGLARQRRAGRKMTTPTVAGGKVYVGAQYTISVYGLATFLTPPVISPNGGVFTNSVTVTISNTAPGAAVYYTADGTTPTTNSTLYTGPFVVSTTTTVQAIAAENGFVNSAVATPVSSTARLIRRRRGRAATSARWPLTGSAFFSNGVFIVSGSGADIWDTADAFRFVYQPIDEQLRHPRARHVAKRHRSVGQGRRDDSRLARPQRRLWIYAHYSGQRFRFSISQHRTGLPPPATSPAARSMSRRTTGFA